MFFIPEMSFMSKNELEVVFTLSLGKITAFLSVLCEKKFYEFSYENIKDYFGNFFGNFKEFFLDKNFRSSDGLVEFFNSFGLKIKKDFVPLKSCGSILNEKMSFSVKWEFVKSDEDLLFSTLNCIKGILKKNADAKIGVLYFNCFEVMPFVSLLREVGISYRFFGEVSLLDVPCIKQIVLVLKIVSSPNSCDMELFKLLKYQNVKDEVIMYYMRKISSKCNSLLKSIRIFEFPEEQEAELVKSVFLKLESLQEKSQVLSISALIREIAFVLGIYDKLYLMKKYEDFESINKFVLLSKTYEKMPNSSLFEFLKFVDLDFKFPVKFDVGTVRDCQVSVMPCGVCDFLEFDCVILLGIEEVRFKKNTFSTFYCLSREDVSQNYYFRIFNSMMRACSQVYMINVKSKSPNLLKVFMGRSPVEVIDKFEPLPIEMKVKCEILDKLNDYVLKEKFALARDELSLLESLFSKNDLNSFIKPKSKYFNFYKDKLLLRDKRENNFFINHNESIYSVSKLRTFISCPKKYVFAYIYKIPAKPKSYFDFGSSLHDVLEKFDFELLKTLPIEIAYAKLLSLFEKSWISLGYESREQEIDYFEKGIYLLRNFLEREVELLGKNHSTILKEERFIIDLVGKDKKLKRIRGIIDRVDRIQQGLHLLDYKTSRKMEEEKDVLKNPQLHIYAEACKKIYGEYPKKLSLWYLLHGKIKTISFDEKNLLKVGNKLLSCIDDIEKEKFAATPSAFACGHCDFNTICEDSFKK